MKIIILGAGQVGSTLASYLCMDNEVTVVDNNAARLNQLQEKINIRTIVGHAAYPTILLNAGADEADVLIALTQSDEVNLISCHLAHHLYKTPRIIARVRATAFSIQENLFDKNVFGIDKLITPEHLVMQYIKRLIEHPDALQVVNFSEGKVKLVVVRAFYGGSLVGQAIKNIKNHMPNVHLNIVSIFRRHQPIAIHQETVIEPDDEVFFLAPSEYIDSIISELRQLTQPYKRIMIGGGGNIGAKLASALEHQYHVKLIEHSKSRAQFLASELNKTIVLCGNIADKELLLEENIQEVDVFCGITNHDEANIMSCLLAKRLGAHKVMSLINRSAYLDIVQDNEIDIAISPEQITISNILTSIRRGNIVSVHTLYRGKVEALEIIVQNDTLKNPNDLPSGITLGAIVRGDEVIIPNESTLINKADHLILFAIDRNDIQQLEALLQKGAL